MHILIGQMTLYLALTLAAVAFVTALAAALRRDKLAWGATRDSLIGSSAMTLAATASLISALVQNDFTLAYVAGNSEIQMPLVYRISALWREASGSLLLWAALLACGAIAYLLIYRRSPSRHHALVSAGIAAQLILLQALLVTAASPFLPTDRPPIDGTGMRLMLQVWAMVIHPPVTFAAYAAFGIAAAISIAALATGKLRESLPTLRQFLLLGWLMMTAGIVLGAYWAYTDLGWGNYWSWDPVENTSLIPWLVATAALHTLRAGPGGPGGPGGPAGRAGNLLGTTHVLSIFTLLTCVLATFVARGGVPTHSRHTYAPSPVANIYLAFMILLLVVSVVLLIVNRRRQPRDEKRVPMTQATAAMTVTVGVLILFSVAVVLGTIGPGIPLWLKQNLQVMNSTGDVVSAIESERFNRLGAVFGMVLLATLGVCPWLMRSTADRRTRLLITNAVIIGLLGVVGIVENIAALWIAAAAALALWIIGGQIYRLTRGGFRIARFSAALAHLAMVMLFAALILSHNLSRDESVTLRPGQSSNFAGMTFRFDNLQRTPLDAQQQFLTTAHLTLLRGDDAVAQLTPAHLRRLDSPDQRGNVHLISRPTADIMVSLDAFDETGQATFTLRRKPAVLWIWVASALLALAAIVGMAVPWRSGRSSVALESAEASDAPPPDQPRTSQEGKA